MSSPGGVKDSYSLTLPETIDKHRAIWLKKDLASFVVKEKIIKLQNDPLKRLFQMVFPQEVTRQYDFFFFCAIQA